MSSIHGSISGQLGKCIEELEKTESPNENNLSELDGVINQIAQIPLNNKFDTQLDKLIQLIPKKYKKEAGDPILKKISSIKQKLFSEDDKLNWMQRKASEGVEQTMGLIEDLNHFDLKNLPRSSLLDLCLLIVKQGDKAQVSFVKNLDKLRLDPLECLDLCANIAQENPNFIQILNSELDKDLFIKEIVKLQLTERLNFCENFAGKRNWAINFLDSHLDNLKFVQEISTLDDSKRIPLCQKLAESGLWTSKGLISNFSQLRLDKVESSVLIELWTKLAETGGAYELAQKFSQIGLEKASADQKISLCIKLIDQHGSAATILLENWKNLGIKETSNTQMIQLCSKIIEKGNSSSISSLIDNFPNLHYSNLSLPEKFSLAIKLIERVDFGVLFFVHNFAEFQLDNLESHQFVELWKKMIDNSGDRELLIKNLRGMGLKKVSLSELLAFYLQLADRQEFASLLVEYFTRLGLDNASTEDRLALVNKLAQNQDAATMLPSKLPHLGLKKVEASQLLTLYVTIVQNTRARKQTEMVTDLIPNLDMDKLLELEPHQRLPLWIAIEKQAEVAAEIHLNTWNLRGFEKQGEVAAKILLKKWNWLEKMSLEERFALWRSLGEHFKNSNETITTVRGRPLADQFHKIGFIEDFQACKSFTERAELSNRIVELGNWGVAGLIKNFDKLGFEEATVAQRLDLCSTLARKGILPAEFMVKYFPLLGFGTTREDAGARFVLCSLINGIRGPKFLEEGLAEELARNIDALGIEGVSYQKKVGFATELVSKGEPPAKELTFKLHFFSPQKEDLLDCLNLCISIAETGEEAAKGLAKNFEALQLPHHTMTESQTQKLIFLLNTLLRNKVLFGDLPLKDRSIPDAVLVKIYIGILLDNLLNQEQISTILEDPRIRDIKPCLELILFKLPLEKDPDYGQKKDEFYSLQKNFQNLLESRREFKLFKDEFEKIKSQDSIFIQSQLIKVLAYATSIFSDLEPMKLDVVMKSHFIETILSHQNPSDRLLLTKELRIAASENIQDIKDLSRDANLSTNAKEVSAPLSPLNNIEKDWGKLTLLLLSHLKTLGLSQEAIVAIVLSIDQRGFSTTKNLTTLLSFFRNLIQKGPFSSEKKQGEKWSEKERLENYLIKTLWDNKALEKIKFLPPNTITEIKDGKKTRTKVDQEDPMKNILGRVEIIKLDTKKPIKKNSKTMAEVQNEIQGSDNIITLFDRKEFFEFLPSNQESSKVFMEHFQELFPVGNIEDLNEKFATSFGDINKFRDPKALHTYVKQLKQLSKEEKDSVNKILTEYVSSVLTGTFKEERYSTKDNPHLEIIFKDPKLKNAWLQAESPRHIANELYISESDDPCDLLLIGTEVPSCQSVTSNPDTSKCLPHYLMGGEIIPIVVKNPKGKLVARSVLRHLIDEKNNPVLLQEKIYSNKPGDLEIEKEINEWAIRKAQSMNCPLVSMREESKKYNGVVKFLGGRAPFQYTDAGGGVKSGPFKIDGLSLIYSPT